MHTYGRALSGLLVATCAVILLLLAAGELYRALLVAGSELPEARKPKPRSYSVVVGTLEATRVTPTITAYGRVQSANTLLLRTRVSGEISEISPNFISGGRVSHGELLFAIDPERLQTAAELARIDLQEAQAEVAEAYAALELARLEVRAAQTQLNIRNSALKRQQDLQSKGLTTTADVDAAILAYSVAEQTLIGRSQLEAQAQARLDQAGIAVERRRIALDEAIKALADAQVFAPFDGVLAEVSAVHGAMVSANEKLGELIDPQALEVAFRVTNTQFSRLLDRQGELRRIDLGVALETGKRREEATARLVRVGAEVGDGQVGRLVYARLDPESEARILPGDFVTLTVPEPTLTDVYLVPATALTADGRLLLVGDDNRLREVRVQQLRQQGDQLVISGVEAGQRYVLARAPQLGSGISVEVVDPRAAGVTPGAAQTAAATTISLDPARRAALIAFVKNNETMQPASKERVLAELAKPEVLLEVVNKFEARMEQP